MKNKKLLALLSAILCLAMIFVSCTKKDNDSEESSDSEVPEVTVAPEADKDILELDETEVPGGSTTDKEVVKNVVNGIAGGTTVEPDAALEAVKGAIYGANFEIDNYVLNGNKIFDSFKISDGMIEASINGDKQYIVMDGLNAVAMIMASKDGEVQVENVEFDVMEALGNSMSGPQYMAAGSSVPQVSPEAIQEILKNYPQIADEDLVHKGNGQYLVKKDYFVKVITYIIDSVAKIAELPTAQVTPIRATVLDYFGRIDVKLLYTVKDSEIVGISEAVSVENDLITEIMSLITGDEKPLPANDYKLCIKSSTVLDKKLPVKASLEADVKIPVATYGTVTETTPGTPAAPETKTLMVVSVNGNIELNAKPGEDENIVALKGTAKGDKIVYNVTADGLVENKADSVPDSMKATVDAHISKTEMKFELDNNGNKISASSNLNFAPEKISITNAKLNEAITKFRKTASNYDKIKQDMAIIEAEIVKRDFSKESFIQGSVLIFDATYVYDDLYINYIVTIGQNGAPNNYSKPSLSFEQQTVPEMNIVKTATGFDFVNVAK